jgi:hypothetical protein
MCLLNRKPETFTNVLVQISAYRFTLQRRKLDVGISHLLIDIFHNGRYEMMIKQIIEVYLSLRCFATMGTFISTGIFS